MRILIAEDDATSRLVLESLLKRWGYEVISTPDGNQAWTALQAKDAPRFAILDWMMPGMDGAEVCRKVRETERDCSTYIILLTALGRKEDIITGLEAGADDYVTKPFDMQELHARIKVGQRIIELQSTLSNRILELQDAMTHIKTLQGILPICMHCHKISDSHESWLKLEEYVEGHSDAQFSHGLCPECLEKYYPETDEETNESESGA